MEKSAAAASPSSAASSGYVAWEEVPVSSDKGRREVHFFLRRRDGGKDLAVVGRERTLRHMSYNCALRSRSAIGLGDSSLVSSLKCRREVVDWLNSVIQGRSSEQQHHADSGFLAREGAQKLDVGFPRDSLTAKLGHSSKEIQWIGSPWTCKKKRKHFPSFLRKGVKVSVHDFVYVLAEEDKRLVAYLDDMFEDSKGNKMVVVQWFHKVDEVGMDLPRNFNDREIFFSLCLQDLSIECIDGLATVLSPQHFNKYMNEASKSSLEIFVCHNLFEEDEMKPFDITQVEGYWNQDVLKRMNPFPLPKPPLRSQVTEFPRDIKCNVDEDGGIRPAKKQRHVKESDDIEMHCSNECSEQKIMKKDPPHHFIVGSEVEVLSQDSGLRGCWYRALIIKASNAKVKVRYQDILDAVDETKKLEEWIPACREASADEFGFRILGRSMIRPSQQSRECEVPKVVDAGTVVDAWWNDGWWEGIVVRGESEGRLLVYFPGEKRELVFPLGDLRHSREWSENRWIHIRNRADIITAISPHLRMDQHVGGHRSNEAVEAAIKDCKTSRNNEAGCENPLNHRPYSQYDGVDESLAVPDLLKDDSLAHLKWKVSRKRSRSGGSSSSKVQFDNDCMSSPEMGICTRARFLIDATLKVEHDNCKFAGDSLFSSSVVPTLTSLVMSR
ncbi:uncharacterized protein LOC115756453 isoform X1 [Rhodamnia argentea]|uniref:Uncharacterized protein LOC115756453 isoform X1 n=1 Tax=Rhodamnia argentea TaxID=178133 RepID=A0A8B8QY05_9MYRT|nr:uncharacterized protein LOC115756453 isoform X1 [Rhodamnia argentea]